MEQKKIATSVDIMIKTASYEYIHVTKYAEKNITYDSKEEMVLKEDGLSKELVNDVVRTLRGIPDQLGQGKTEIVEAEEKIKTRIPEWLGSDPEPNIANIANPVSSANMAKKNNDKSEAEIKAKEEEKLEKSNRESSIVEDLFDEKDSPSETKETEASESSKNEENKPELKKSENIEFEDLFADDTDLFENK